MPGSFEAGLRITEHYLGRDNVAQQARGNFVHLPSAPSLSAGRVVRNRSGVITGVYAQDAASVSSHGVRPAGSFPMECMPEDLVQVLMSFFHNREYTEVTPASANRAVGTFKYAMPDAVPDHTGIVVGTYSPTAESLLARVSIADAYTIALELLYGHGHLGDTNNGLALYNWITNELTFESSRGPENVLQATVGGFARDADVAPDFAQTTWGPGLNGGLSAQNPFVPEVFSFELLTVNGVDKISVYEDWMDGIRITMRSGLAGRDALGHDEYNTLTVDNRPSAEVRLMMAHVGSDFITALTNSQKIGLTVKYTTGANEYLQFKFPYMKIAENFDPSIGAPGSDVSIEVPLIALLDLSADDALVEVELRTSFDVRTNSFYGSSSLAVI